MELENQVVEKQEVQAVEETKEVEQETQPVEKTEETKDEVVKTFTQKELDDIIDRRIKRLKESSEKEKESVLTQKEQEYQEKLKSYESDRNLLAEQLKERELELQRVQYGIKKEAYEEALLLKEFKMKKDESLTDEEALKLVLKERPDYKDKLTEPIGIELSNKPTEVPLYSESLLNMYPYLRKVK
jgi:hypothetical protein